MSFNCSLRRILLGLENNLIMQLLLATNPLLFYCMIKKDWQILLGLILFISKICSQLHLSLFYRYLALRQTIRVNIEKDMALQLLLEQLGNIAMNICSQKIVTDQRGDRVCLASLPVRRCCINSGEVSVQQQSRGVVTGCRPHFLSHRSRTMSQWFTQFSRMDLRPSRFDPSEPR